MRDIVKVCRRPPAVRPRDRNGGFPRLSGCVAHGSRCAASPHHALLAEKLGKPSLWVNIKDLWYQLSPRKSLMLSASFSPWNRIQVTPATRQATAAMMPKIAAPAATARKILTICQSRALSRT